ncbi:50S ribosomal protein L6 [Candidatus Micrarchaeota archaeon]|nr:50S ribosomal protein L6 [Candidatus Micrarchaeota archaeon]
MNIPEGISVNVDGLLVKVKGPKGEVEKRFMMPKTSIKVEGSALQISTTSLSMNNTIEAIIACMFKGVSEGYMRKLKVVYAHFPFSVEVKGNVVNIKNFLGERLNRTARILGNTKVEPKGQEVTISGSDKEAVGQTVANIKNALKINNKDSRVFQDGLYEIR